MSQSELESAGADDSLPQGVIGYMRDGRKRYAPEFRRSVARECRESGQSVAGIALRYGINANLVRRWMTQYASPETALLPVSLSTMTPVREHTEPVVEGLRGSMEIALSGGTVRIIGAVDRNALSAVIDVLSQR